MRLFLLSSLLVADLAALLVVVGWKLALAGLVLFLFGIVILWFWWN